MNWLPNSGQNRVTDDTQRALKRERGEGGSGTPGRDGRDGPPGEKGADGHSPVVAMTGDQVTIDGVPTGPHLTGEKGEKGDTGEGLTPESTPQISGLGILIALSDLFSLETAFGIPAIQLMADIDTPGFGAGMYCNILTRGCLLSTSPWATTNLVATTGVTDPVGDNQAQSLAGSAADGEIRQPKANTGTGLHTFSVFLQGTVPGQQVQLRIDTNAPSAGTAKTVTLSTSWRRYAVTEDIQVGHTQKIPKILVGNQTVNAWGAQLAVGDKPLVLFKTDTNYQNTPIYGVLIRQANLMGSSASIINFTNIIANNQMQGATVSAGGTVGTNLVAGFQSTTKAGAWPRMTTTQRDAISTKSEGMMIYNLTTHTVDFWNGTTWKQIAGV